MSQEGGVSIEHSLEWDIEGTVQYVLRRGYQRVALQFPDELLQHAHEIYDCLSLHLKSQAPDVQVFLLADTTFNSLAVDEVAAEHANADCVVHYGHASLSPLSKIPAYFVFPARALEEGAVVSHILRLRGRADVQCTLVLLDLAYVHARQQLARLLEAENVSAQHVVIADVPANHQDPGPAPASQPCAHDATRDAAHRPQTSLETDPAQSSCNRAIAPFNTAATPCCGSSCETNVPPPSTSVPCCMGAALDGANASTQTSKPASPKAGPSVISRAAQCTQSATAESVATGPATTSDSPHEVAHRSDPASNNSARGPAYPVGGLQWTLPPGCASEQECHMLWVGPSSDSAALTQLLMTYSASSWSFYDPATAASSEGLPAEVGRRLMRRHFLVEKAKNCAIIGILVGTLGVAGYLSVIERLRALAKQAGKKTYTMLMGKPSPVKLANFPEVEVWVQVADPQALILDSKEYLAPIITPFEAEIALLGLPWDPTKYRMDFASVLEATGALAPNATSSSPRFSLVDGAYHATRQDGQGADEDEGTLALAVQADRAMQLAASTGPKERDLIQPSNAAEFMLLKRSFQGAPSPLVGSDHKPVELAAIGLSGRAAGYRSERDEQSRTGT